MCTLCIIDLVKSALAAYSLLLRCKISKTVRITCYVSPLKFVPCRGENFIKTKETFPVTFEWPISAIRQNFRISIILMSKKAETQGQSLEKAGNRAQNGSRKGKSKGR